MDELVEIEDGLLSASEPLMTIWNEVLCSLCGRNYSTQSSQACV